MESYFEKLKKELYIKADKIVNEIAGKLRRMF